MSPAFDPLPLKEDLDGFVSLALPPSHLCGFDHTDPWGLVFLFFHRINKGENVEEMRYMKLLNVGSVLNLCQVLF